MSDNSGVRQRKRHSERSGQIDELVSAVLTASRVLVAVSASSLAEIEETVTLTQFRTLVVLHTRGKTNLNGLADALDVNASTAMRMIDKLLAAGLVTREENPANRREVVLDLTRNGAELVARVTERRRAEIARIVRRMPTSLRDDLVKALSTFADAAGEPHAGAAAGVFGW